MTTTHKLLIAGFAVLIGVIAIAAMGIYRTQATANEIADRAAEETERDNRLDRLDTQREFDECVRKELAQQKAEKHAAREAEGLERLPWVEDNPDLARYVCGH